MVSSFIHIFYSYSGDISQQTKAILVPSLREKGLTVKNKIKLHSCHVTLIFFSTFYITLYLQHYLCQQWIIPLDSCSLNKPPERETANTEDFIYY